MAAQIPPLGHVSPRMPALVGRERERAVLRDLLAAAHSGKGGFVLLSGEAGIGKTTLVETLTDEATAAGMLALTGGCYDLTETSPYGAWLDLFRRFPRERADPPLPVAFTEPGMLGDISSQAVLFHQMLAFLTAHAAQRPLLIVLDDMHWADVESLDLLRFLARSLASVPLVLIITYRPNEGGSPYPLSRLLPTLVREGHAERVDLRPLHDAAVHELVTARYALPHAETDRLVAYVQERAEGNPFFLGELLRTLQDADVLTETSHGWALNELVPIQVPLLLRQVIGGRLDRIGAEARRLLAIAAVIGQELSLVHWRAIVADESGVLACIERATEAHLLDSSPAGTHVRFVHALIRQTLYESILPARRRMLHQQVGDAMAMESSADPNVVAYHFQQAGDERAIPWLIRAGERAERAYAWLTAADRFEAAVTLMDARDGDAGERGWLRYRIGTHRRYANPRQSITDLAEAGRLAALAHDDALAANALANIGLLRCQAGNIRQGLIDQEAATVALRALSATDHQRLAAQPTHYLTADETDGRGTYALWLAIAGRFAEAQRLGEQVVAGPFQPIAPGQIGGSPRADAYDGLAQTYAALGFPEDARRAYAHARAAYRAVGHHYRTGLNAVDELRYALRFRADDLAERRRLMDEAEEVWMRASGTVIDLPRIFARVPLLPLTGQPTDACPLLSDAPSTLQWIARSVHDSLALLHGDTDLAWADRDAMIPDGPTTEPGNTPFLATLVLQRLAAMLAIDDGDLDTARAWLEAHDRWLAWSGAVLGRAEGHLGWAIYYRAVGETTLAYQHATIALTHATEPRQPLALLAAHRMLGELDTAAGRLRDAGAHLNAAMALADACAAPYERCLTLLAQVELLGTTEMRQEALALLEEAQAVCLRLDAQPALTRAKALAARLTVADVPTLTYPDGLTVREVAVLRLIAAGRSNRQIAATLFISVRTVNRHIENLYRKIGAHGKAEATAYTFRHHLA